MACIIVCRYMYPKSANPNQILVLTCLHCPCSCLIHITVSPSVPFPQLFSSTSLALWNSTLKASRSMKGVWHWIWLQLASLIGRILTDKQIRFKYLQERLSQLWQPWKGVAIIHVDHGKYLFQFYNKIDVEKVLNGRPFAFSRTSTSFSKRLRRVISQKWWFLTKWIFGFKSITYP